IDAGRGAIPGSTVSGKPPSDADAMGNAELPASTPASELVGRFPSSAAPGPASAGALASFGQTVGGFVGGSCALRSPTPPSRYGTPSGHADPGKTVAGRWTEARERVVLPRMLHGVSAPGTPVSSGA